jgi:hypothetical protein
MNSSANMADLMATNARAAGQAWLDSAGELLDLPRSHASPSSLPDRQQPQQNQADLAQACALHHLIGSAYLSNDIECRFGDFPMQDGEVTMPDNWRQNPILSNALRFYSGKSNQELLKIFEREFNATAQHNLMAQRLLRHFAEASGSKFISPAGCEWSNLIARDSEGQRIANTMRFRIQDAAENQLRITNRIDPSTLTVRVEPCDFAAWQDKPWSSAFGVLGGTDGLQVGIFGSLHDNKSSHFNCIVRINIISTFGADNTSSETPGKMAMWILQHQRGIKPFKNEVSFDVRLSMLLPGISRSPTRAEKSHSI